MQSFRDQFAGVLAIVCLVSSLASADVKVEQQTFGPDGQLFGGSISLKGQHIAVLAAKGSHYQVIMDGVAGPKIDGLIFNICGDPFRPGTMWGNMPIPVIFSKDGLHWAYMAKQSDEYVVMLDGKEFARGPINTRNSASNLNLTFSALGQHVFWSDTDAQGNYVIVADGKPGPAMQNLPTLVLSPDGNQYAYVNYNRDGSGAWAVVNGRQVNYFGDELEYTPRNVLLSMAHIDGNTIFVINGKPAIKALNVTPKWTSPDGKQIAMIITPQQGVATFLMVDGKKIDGTDGLIVEKVYFSPDGKRYAALCDTKTGSKFMIVDGKKGDEYPTISQQIGSLNNTHWSYVTWKSSGDFSDLEPTVPGFTADSSKFVYVANSNGRQFLVVDDDESNAYGDTLLPTLSAVGNRYGAIGATPDHIQHIIIDGTDTAYGQTRISQLTFSPDGAHYAFLAQNTVYLDNVLQPGLLQGNYIFSPDGKHIAYQSTGTGKQCVIVDGKDICDRCGNGAHIFFSPDSNHIYWVSTQNLAMLGFPGTKDSNLLYVDGKPAAHYQDNGVQMDPLTDAYVNLHCEYTADDVMSFFARTDGNIRRFRVTSDTDLGAVLAAAPVAK